MHRAWDWPSSAGLRQEVHHIFRRGGHPGICIATWSSGPAGAGPCRVVDRYRAVSQYEHDVLAPPTGGDFGGDGMSPALPKRGKRGSFQDTGVVCTDFGRWEEGETLFGLANQ